MVRLYGGTRVSSKVGERYITSFGELFPSSLKSPKNYLPNTKSTHFTYDDRFACYISVYVDIFFRNLRVSESPFNEFVNESLIKSNLWH